MNIVVTSIIINGLLIMCPLLSPWLFKHGKFGSIDNFREAVSASERGRSMILKSSAIAWWIYMAGCLSSGNVSLGCAVTTVLLSLTIVKEGLFSAFACELNDIFGSNIIYAMDVLIALQFLCMVACPGWLMIGNFFSVIFIIAWFFPNTTQIWRHKFNETRKKELGLSSEISETTAITQ